MPGKARIAAALTFDARLYSAYGAEAASMWNFDEESGSTLYDVSGRNSAPIPINVTRVPGHRGGDKLDAIRFTNAAYVLTNNAIQFGSTWTIASWVKADSYANSIYLSFSLPYMHMQPSGNFRVSWMDQNNVQKSLAEVGGGRVLNRWYHVAASHYNGVTTLYVDGKEVARTTQYSSASRTGKLRMGNHGTDATYAFYGSIDDVRIYTQSLNVAEIHELYAQGRTETKL